MNFYEFDGNQYVELNDLALAFANKYKLAINNVYANYKSLIKFLKTKTKDKLLLDRIRNDLAFSKSKNSAITFIIFELLTEKAVYINGVKLSFEDFCSNMANLNDEKEHVLLLFLEDQGLEKTYARMKEYAFLKDDASYLDAHYNSPETIAYLVNFYKEDSEEVKVMLEDILKGSEKFRKFAHLSKESSFITYISHSYGFKDVSRSLNSLSKVFAIAKILAQSKDFNYDEILSIFDDTFYLWLINNLKNYKYKKSEAKETYKRLKAYKKDYDKLMEKAKKAGLNSLVNKKSTTTYFDLVMDMHSKLFNEYLYFAQLSVKGFIIAKGESYKLDLPYMSTYIAESYRENRMLILAKENEEVTENKEFSFEDTSGDLPTSDIVKNTVSDKEKIDLVKKIERRNKTLALFAIIFGILVLILGVGLPVALAFMNFEWLTNIVKHNYNFDELYKFIFYGGIAFVIAFIAAISLSVRSAKTSDRLTDLLFIKTCKNESESLTVLQKERFAKIEGNEKELERSLKDYHRPLSLTVIFFNLLQVSLLTYFALLLVSNMGVLSNIFKGISFDIFPFFASIFAGPVVFTVILLFKKTKNNWLLLLFGILNMGIVFGLSQFLFPLILK